MKIGFVKKFILLVNEIGIKHSLVHGEKQREVLSKVMPGDAILVRAAFEATNRLIDGHFTHCILKDTDIDLISDATESGVSLRDILNSFVGISDICVMRPRLSKEDCERIASRGRWYCGKKIGYDYSFGLGTEEMYCSEYYYHCYNDVNPNELKLMDRFGFNTITPDDIAKCNRLFERVV
jgi:hypothetical protein